MRGKLERVLAYDSIHDTEYTRTLRAYLDAFGDVAAAAAENRHPPEHVPLPTAPARRALRPRARESEERLVIELPLRLLGDDRSRPQS